MTEVARPRTARRPRRRGPRLRRAALRLLAVAAIFAAGVALGQALRDNPRSGGDRTQVRTLRPLPLPPAVRTVTVTVANG